MSTYNTNSIGETITKYRWTICALLFFATAINYLDRQVLSLLVPELEKLYGWSNSDYANITVVFQVVYALSMLFAGKFVDIFGNKKGFSIAIVVWSLGAILHAYAVEIGESVVNLTSASISASILGFMISRAVLAVGEAANFPAAVKVTAEFFPKRERAFATGIFNSGANIGAILAPIFVPLMSKIWGWQSAFIIIGAVGFVWMIFWILMYDKPENHKKVSQAELNYINSDLDETEKVEDAEEKELSWSALLKYKQTWAFVSGKFLTDGVWWFFLFWLPKFLKTQYGLEKEAIMFPLAVLYSLTMVGSISGGWFPKYFINKGYNAFEGRMRAMIIIAIIPLVVLLAQPFGDISVWVPVILIGIGASAHQAWSANLFTTVSDMFPKKSVASVVGIGGMAGGLGGVLINKLAGYIFDYYENLGNVKTGYTVVFVYCAIAYLLAWFIMKTLIPKYKKIELN